MKHHRKKKIEIPGRAGSVVDQEKNVSLYFRRDESRCCAAGSPASSKNKDTSFS